jgi:hypothetical protein
VKPSGLEQPRNVRKRNRSFRGSKDLAKHEALSTGVTATDVDKTVLPQSAITDTVDEIISVGQPHTTVKAKDDGVNAVETLEDSSRRGGAGLEVVSLGAKPIFQGDAEIRGQDQKRQKAGLEDNRTTEEYARGRSTTALTRLNVSTEGLSKEHPISLLSSSSPVTPQWTVWDNESEMLIHN